MWKQMLWKKMFIRSSANKDLSSEALGGRSQFLYTILPRMQHQN